MSVINKMLRDLDSRQATGTAPLRPAQVRTGVARDTLIVNDSDPGERRRRSPWSAVLLGSTLVAIGGTVAWWHLTQNLLPPRQLELVLTTPSVAPAQAVLAVAPALVASAAASAPVAVAVPEPVAMAAAVPPLAPLPVAVPVAAPNPLPERVANERARATAPAKPTGAASAATTAALAKPLHQSAALEVLAQAQSLWNAGSHAAAIDMLREALDAAERANGVAAPGGHPATLAALARELARMELAEGRVQQALEMLKRLEPVLSDVADVWALRGNAAQRLGYHPESAAAYQTALKLRPNEPRWMLGAAVSLAAQGHTAAAAELAEKARLGGVLNPEVTAYLRQLGVTLRER